jgi:hypothetical protein
VYDIQSSREEKNTFEGNKPKEKEVILEMDFY